MNLIAAMTDNDEATDQVYNVALNDRTSLNQLFRMIEERLIQRVDGLTKKNHPIETSVLEMCVIHRQILAKHKSY